MGPSWGASLPPPAMPAALRLLCGVVVPAAMLCAEPLPRVTFSSGEYGTGTRGTGKSWDSWGGTHNICLGECPSPGLSIQHQKPWDAPHHSPSAPSLTLMWGWRQCQWPQVMQWGMRVDEAAWHPNTQCARPNSHFVTHLAPRVCSGSLWGDEKLPLEGTRHGMSR